MPVEASGQLASWTSDAFFPCCHYTTAYTANTAFAVHV